VEQCTPSVDAACGSACSNGALDSGERDVDCGGVCTYRCAEGMYCSSSADCDAASGLVCGAAGACVSGEFVCCYCCVWC
jgi:hypothetical protein